MTELKELAYLSTWTEMKLGIPQVRKGQPFPFQLEKFIWTPSLSTRYGHRSELLEFFEIQHNLQDFLCTSSSFPRSIPSELLPNLKVVEGDIYGIKALVQTRHITEIYWRDCSGYDLKERMDPQQPLFRDTVLPLVRGLSLQESGWTTLVPNDGPLQGFVRTRSSRHRFYVLLTRSFTEAATEKYLPLQSTL